MRVMWRKARRTRRRLGQKQEMYLQTALVGEAGSVLTNLLFFWSFGECFKM